MNYRTMKIEDIIEWCKANNQVEWLKAKAAETVPYKVYPKIKIDGRMIIDKTVAPTIEMRPISFIQIKLAFAEKFMPEIAPKKQPKKPTMYDIIANL